MIFRQALPFLLILAFSCGPSDDETNNGNNGTTGGTTGKEMVIRSTFAIDEVDTAVTATAMNQDGSEVAVATRNLRTYEEKVRIFSTTDGSFER